MDVSHLDPSDCCLQHGCSEAYCSGTCHTLSRALVCICQQTVEGTAHHHSLHLVTRLPTPHVAEKIPPMKIRAVLIMRAPYKRKTAQPRSGSLETCSARRCSDLFGSSLVVDDYLSPLSTFPASGNCSLRAWLQPSKWLFHKKRHMSLKRQLSVCSIVIIFTILEEKRRFLRK